MMKKYLILSVLVLLPLLVMGQTEPLCPTCKKKVSLCQYKGKHPKPQPESKCPTCKKVISKCQYKGKHPKPQPEPEAAGYDVTFTSNVPTASMSIDGVANGTASGSRFLKTGTHTVRLSAIGYDDLSQTITVSSSSRSFTLNMKKQESITPDNQQQKPVDNTPTRPAEAAGYDVTFTSNVPSASMSIDGVANGTASGSRFLKTGTHTVSLSASGYDDLSQTITVSSSSLSFTLTMKKLENTLSPVLQNLVNNMVRVEGGTFRMGWDMSLGFESHKVTLSSFSIGKYEVTQEEWDTVMGSNPSNFKGAKRPVEKVSWNDCQEFIRKLNQMTGKRFRLPTEAEWEFAARGGNRSNGYKYAGSNSLTSVAWYDDNSGNETHPVGQKQANELGLYDMSGNVYEWCQDWYGSYSSSSQTNPTGPSSASGRVNRGGCWCSSARDCRVSNHER